MQFFVILIAVKQARTRTAELTFFENEGYVLSAILQDAEIDAEDAKETLYASLEMTNYKLFPVLLDGRKIKSISHEARGFYASEEVKKYQTAVAVIADSLPTRLIANFFLKFHKLEFRIKIFPNEEKAKKWLGLK